MSVHCGLSRLFSAVFLLQAVCAADTSAQMSRAAETSCGVKDTAFELWTGFVYTAPDHLMDTQTGVLLLEQCVELCRSNSTCMSLNYETGLCVLFSTNAEILPGGLSVSDYPLFTHYLQKVCLGSVYTVCGPRSWTFERVRSRRLARYTQRTLRVASRAACQQMCLHEKHFACRSVSYSSELGECVLSQVDRFSLDSGEQLLNDTQFDYYESNCVQEPVSVCQFEPLHDRILKTVDAVHQGVASRPDCEQLCKAAPFRCHTYDHDAVGPGVCRLSHHSGAATLRHIRQPFLTVKGAKSWQRQSCYNVTLQCDGARMLANVRTGRIFNGKIYARGSPNSCVKDVQGQMSVNFELGYHDLNCDVQQAKPGVFVSEIIIQHHDKVVTGADVGLSLRCMYALGDTKVSQSAGLAVAGSVASAGHQSTSVRSPNISMTITDREGIDIATAQVGDALALRFEIVDADSPYQLMVRHLVAQDGTNSAEIELLDTHGCPTDPAIMGAVTRVNDSPQLLHVPFAAFKFPSSGVVQFKALVTPCLPSCAPVNCSVNPGRKGAPQTVQSYGRRRKRTVDEQDILVIQRINIVDTFPFKSDQPMGESGPGGHVGGASGGEASSERVRHSISSHEWQSGAVANGGLPVAAIAGSCVGLLLLQLVMVGTWQLVARSRRRSEAVAALTSSAVTPSKMRW